MFFLPALLVCQSFGESALIDFGECLHKGPEDVSWKSGHENLDTRD